MEPNKSFGITAFCILCLLFYSKCESLERPKDDFIIAGDSTLYFLNDCQFSVEASNNTDDSILFDINNDGKFDINCYSHNMHFHGGGLALLWCSAKGVNNTEILSDTSTKDVVYAYLYNDTYNLTSYTDTAIVSHKFDVPVSLEYGDIISKDGIWTTNNWLDLSFYTQSVSNVNDTIIKYTTHIFKGWNDLNNKYLAYRYFENSDTIYGWIQLAVDNYYQVYIHRWAHQ